jgi:hypothetical protein
MTGINDDSQDQKLSRRSENGNDAASPAQPSPSQLLPFSKWWPLLAGAMAGIALRLVFSGKPGNAYAAMMSSFIYLSPVLVVAVTVYVAEKKARRRWMYYVTAPFLANVLYVVGTMLIMIEGLVCAVIIVPLFAALGALGGLLMGAICRVTKWPKQTLYSLGALPLILGSIETGMPLPQRVTTVEKSILINARPADVWHQINNAQDIKPYEVQSAWLFRIGVPVPLMGVTRRSPEGWVRRVIMGKGIHFDQVVTDWDENRHVRWTYRFEKDSFPDYALDEHVVLGGHYFDIKDTS